MTELLPVSTYNNFDGIAEITVGNIKIPCNDVTSSLLVTVCTT
jgi:hypothetical protein